MPSRDHHSISDERLRQRYEELRALRETQPEKEATAARKALDKSREASDLLVATLRAELAKLQQPESTALQELRAENAALRGQLAEVASAASSASAAADPSVSAPSPPSSSSALEAKLEFYEMMTGMRVEMAEGDVARCVVACAAPTDDQENDPSAAAAQPPPPRRAAFEMRLKPEEGEPGVDLEYVPTDLSGCAEAELPEYLRESIVFERSQAPGFLQRLLAGVSSA